MSIALDTILKRRILLVTGKGGVGKTTMCAALARLAEAQGRRVLALDIEKEMAAPSLLLRLLAGKERFERDEPIKISPSLHCARLSPAAGHEIFLRDNIPVRLLAEAAIRSKHLNRFLMAAPGFQEMGILYRALPYLRKNPGQWSYDTIVADLPATGHALALTSLPQPLLQVFQSGPVAQAIHESQAFFYDEVEAGCVVVTLPEPLPISETFELLAGLRRDRVSLVGIVVNRMPEDPLTSIEMQRLLAIYRAHPHHLVGEWSLRRILRAKEALARLQNGLDKRDLTSTVLILPEQWTDDPHRCLDGLIEFLRTPTPTTTSK